MGITAHVRCRRKSANGDPIRGFVVTIPYADRDRVALVQQKSEELLLTRNVSGFVSVLVEDPEVEEAEELEEEAAEAA